MYLFISLKNARVGLVIAAAAAVVLASLATTAFTTTTIVTSAPTTVPDRGAVGGLPGVGPVPAGLGLVGHFTVPDPAELKMFAGTGATWVRMDFQWEVTEPKRGEYKFNDFDKALAALDQSGIRPIWILDYGNKLYDPDGASPHTDASRAAYAKWAAAAVQHFAGRGILWEIWNEPNDWFWKPKVNADEYIRMARAAAAAIRAAAPGETLIGPAVSGVGVKDLSFLEACCKGGCLADWAAVSVHPYRGDDGGDPETVAVDYANIRKLIDRYRPAGKTIPILSDEWGYSTAYRDYTPEKQGEMLGRELIVNLWQQVPLSIWYEWRDDGNDPKDREQNFGLVRHDPLTGGLTPCTPKPAYVALKTLTSQLDGFTCDGRLALSDPADYAIRFVRGSDVRLVVWTTAVQPRDATLSQAADVSFGAVDWAGHPLGDPFVGGHLRLTDAVTYLVPKGDAAALKAVPVVK